MFTKKQTNKTQKNKIYNKTKKLKGGRFIEEGGFGCIVTPALSCSKHHNKHKDKNNDINLNKLVSKIIINPDEDVYDEIHISNRLKTIDPTNKYYISFTNYCYINENDLKQNRKDIVSVKYKSKSLSKFDLLDKEKKDKKKCKIDLSMKPINLIMPFAGLSLSEVMHTNHKGTNIKAIMHSLFINNLKSYFKHLIIGLIKLHHSRIVNRDIKQSNIMLYLNKNDGKNSKTNITNKIKNKKIDDDNYNYDNDNRENNDDSDDNENSDDDSNTEKHKKHKHKYNIDNIDPTNMIIRYIDFGLSNIITNKFIDIDNISVRGTYRYVSPEIFICYIINKHDTEKDSSRITRINNYINKYVVEAIIRINEKDVLYKLKNNILNIYKTINDLFKNKKILEKYFGSDTNKYNGYLQKADVYALGLTIFDTLYKYSNIEVKKHKKLHDLLSNMIEIDPDKRFNAITCLSHPYFTSL